MFNLMQNHQLLSLFTANIPIYLHFEKTTFSNNLCNYANKLINYAQYKKMCEAESDSTEKMA